MGTMVVVEVFTRNAQCRDRNRFVACGVAYRHQSVTAVEEAVTEYRQFFWWCVHRSAGQRSPGRSQLVPPVTQQRGDRPERVAT